MQPMMDISHPTDTTDTADSGPVPRRRRRRRTVLLVVASVLAVAGAATYAWLKGTSAPRVTGTTSCAAAPLSSADGVGDPDAVHAAVCRTLDGLTAAWDAGDAEAYGALFTDDATYVSFVGTVYAGRADIVAGHDALFGGLLKGSRLTARYLDLRATGPDTVVVVARGDTYEGDDVPERPSKVQTFVLARQADGTWRVAAFHNTQRRDVMERVQFLMEPGSRPAAER